ncbi:hypothetical protein D3C86_2219740 [compost metagenome]
MLIENNEPFRQRGHEEVDGDACERNVDVLFASCTCKRPDEQGAESRANEGKGYQPHVAEMRQQHKPGYHR